MKTEDIEIGLRVFNRGDMANIDHWGTITNIIKSHRFSDQVEITPDPDSVDRDPYCVSPVMISEIDKGHGGTRIVTEKAHNKYRQKQINAFNAMMVIYFFNQRTISP